MGRHRRAQAGDGETGMVGAGERPGGGGGAPRPHARADDVRIAAGAVQHRGLEREGGGDDGAGAHGKSPRNRPSAITGKTVR